MSLKELISYFSDFYFTNLVMISLSIILLIYGFYYFKKLQELKIVIIYGIFSLIQTLITYYVLFIIPYDLNYIIEFSINIFLITEFLLFYLFFFLIIKSKYVKYLLLCLACSFIIITIYHWKFTNELYKNPAQLTVIECFYMLIPALYYYIELFQYSPIINLRKESNFWIVTGIMFFFTTIIPLFLLKIFVFDPADPYYESLYSITYIAYSLLFIMFLIGCRCKVKKI